MAYTLKKLNVVKTVEGKSRRDALLDKGFELVEVEEKKAATNATEQNEKKGNDSAKQADKPAGDLGKQDKKAGGDT